MAEHLLRFTTIDQQQPPKRPASARAQDFGEISQHWVLAKAEEQSSRCSQCGVPFCQVHCPLGNNIPDWLRLTAEGRIEEAYEMASSTSTMPEICGRICPQDRLCEGNCVIEGSGHGSVTIGAIEKHIGDTAWEMGWVPPLLPVRDRSAQSVGIIGAGPAGLTAAEYLRAQGYDVHVYDRHDRPGGLLIYGIPGFKLEKPVVARRTDRLAKGGVRFHLDCEVGRDVSFAELRRRHDALLVACGVYEAKQLDVEHGGTGVVPALDYLIAATRHGLGETVVAFEDGRLNAAGHDVVVIGGGDTAMDCVRTALRQGAASVTCLYRRDRANMPGSAREVANAEEEGVRFEWLAAPVAFEGHGPLEAVVARRMRLGSSDSTGRRAAAGVPGSEFRLPATLAIQALGFDAESIAEAWDAPDIATTRWGTMIVEHPMLATAIAGVFAAGDIVRGASLVVWAVRDGREVAKAMHKYLCANVTSRVRVEMA